MHTFVVLAAAAVIALNGPASQAHAAETTPLSRIDDRVCLTSAIYYEAAREPDAGQQAVARVVLNRLADPAYPKTICAVVYEGSARASGCQFTFTCDGSLRHRPDPQFWERAAAVAAVALDTPDALQPLAALNYHADYVRPVWAGAMTQEARIGRHIFYTRRSGRAAQITTPPSASGEARAVAVVFSPWGLPVARLTPAGGAVAVADAAPPVDK